MFVKAEYLLVLYKPNNKDTCRLFVTFLKKKEHVEKMFFLYFYSTIKCFRLKKQLS